VPMLHNYFENSKLVMHEIINAEDADWVNIEQIKDVVED